MGGDNSERWAEPLHKGPCERVRSLDFILNGRGNERQWSAVLNVWNLKCFLDTQEEMFRQLNIRAWSLRDRLGLVCKCVTYQLFNNI